MKKSGFIFLSMLMFTSISQAYYPTVVCGTGSSGVSISLAVGRAQESLNSKIDGFKGNSVEVSAPTVSVTTLSNGEVTAVICATVTSK